MLAILGVSRTRVNKFHQTNWPDWLKYRLLYIFIFFEYFHIFTFIFVFSSSSVLISHVSRYTKRQNFLDQSQRFSKYLSAVSASKNFFAITKHCFTQIDFSFQVPMQINFILHVLKTHSKEQNIIHVKQKSISGQSYKKIALNVGLNCQLWPSW